jgi:UTP--glucose-1-phosphate uridylyltransferase
MPSKDSKWDNDFQAIEQAMRSEGLAQIAIDTFRYYYCELRDGNTGLIDRTMIEAVESLPDLETLEDYCARGREVLPQTVMIKLNGGLGTSMGLDRAKSLLPAKYPYSFLDIIVKQVLHLRQAFNCNFPACFMNSFSTEKDTLEALGQYPQFADGQKGIPVSFVQNKVPKIRVDDFKAVEWPASPAMGWCPPGHGDLYTALVQTELLAQLVDAGYRYAFVSNADNLGAVIDEQLLGYFADSGLPFLMEVADRTEADKKGGHLAASKSGGLVLRESAQCPDDEEAEFQDVDKFKYFNTNSLWFDLCALQKTLRENNNILKLPLIRNTKTVDPKDKASTKVYQLETAMGSAISAFEGAGAIRVPRSRFAPVKKTDDLIVLWSDVYELDRSGKVVQNSKRTLGDISVFLDPEYYAKVEDYRARFPHGVPSLIDCKRLEVKGDVLFGKNVHVSGEVMITNGSAKQLVIDDNTVITSDITA